MKPPVDAPTSRQTRPAGIDPERVERRRELVAAAADVRLRARRRSIATRRRRRGRPACGRAARRRPPRPGPGRRGSAPGPARASRRGRARRGAGRGAADAGRGVRRRVALTRLSWHSRLHRGSPAQADGDDATEPTDDARDRISLILAAGLPDPHRRVAAWRPAASCWRSAVGVVAVGRTLIGGRDRRLRARLRRWAGSGSSCCRRWGWSARRSPPIVVGLGLLAAGSRSS